MNIGQCLDHIQEWIDNNAVDENGKPIEKQSQARKANQADFNAF
ncbi:hypothetical protein [Bavariicoccus seileri]|nr:hypothetical protein [Bavariicoccus seileri]